MPAAPPRAIRILDAETDADAVGALLDRRASRNIEVDRTVAAIVARVRSGGDRALLGYAKGFGWQVSKADLHRR